MNKEVKAAIKEEPELYINKGFGISIEIPPNWKDYYTIYEEKNELLVLFKSHKVKPINKFEGLFFIIIKNPKNGDGDMLDDLGNKYSTFNGIPYIIAGPLDFTIRENHPEMKKFLEMYKDKKKVANSVRGYK